LVIIQEGYGRRELLIDVIETEGSLVSLNLKKYDEQL